MKGILKHLVVIGGIFLIRTICYGQICDYSISTNPDSPVNSQMSTIFPSLDNQFLNTFDFGEIQNQTLKPIALNPAAGWTVPDWTNPPIFQMRNPFEDGGTAGGGYLETPTNIFQRDFHWEDGWELLWLNTGYYPNGDPIEVLNPNGIVPFAFTVDNTRVPYMIYYNRYTGKIRLFAGLFTDFGAFQSAYVNLHFSQSDVYTNNVNGALRHLSSYDTPLDQPSSVMAQTGVNTLSADTTTGQNNIKVWYTYDFQMAYDPCVCGQTTNLDFQLEAVESSDINLYGRMITLQEDLVNASGTPMYDDGFLSVQDVEAGISDGYIMRDKLASLVRDYKTNLHRYNQALDDQKFGQIGWVVDILDDIADQGLGEVVNLLPTSALATFFVKHKLTLGVDTTDVEKFLAKGANSLLGQGYDFLSSTIFGDNVDPVRPTIPTASFSEMRFSGNIFKSNTVPLTGFLTPGNSITNTNITPFNYPAYNKPVGLYATLKTLRPEVLINESLSAEDTLNITTVADSSEYFAIPQFVPVYTHYDTTVVKSKTVSQAIYLRLPEALKYALNDAVDFDMDETQIYFSCNFTMENGAEWSYSDLTLIDSVKNNFSDNTNLWPLHDIKNPDSQYSSFANQRRIELTSGWYEIEDITNLLFGTTFQSTTYYRELYEGSIFQGVNNYPPYWEDEFDSHVPDTDLESIKFRPVKIELKVLADMNFEQLSSTGKNINTTQVFTYLIYDEAKGVNFLGNGGEFLPGSSLFSFVNMFPGDLTIESNVLFPNAAEIFFSNYGADPLSVIADRIIVNDDLKGYTDSNGEGATYNLQAYSEIRLDTGAHLLPNLHLEIKRDLYGGAQSIPATQSELLSFCSDTSQYGAATASKSAKSREQKSLISSKVNPREEVKSLQVKIHPNPTNSQIRITSSSKPISEIEIFDLSGRSLIHQKTGAEINTIAVNVAALQSGVYIVQTLCGDERSTEKLVISK